MAGLQYDRGVQVVIFPPQDLAAPEPTPPIVINPTPPIAGVPAIPQLHVTFQVTKSLTPEPNQATIRIMNLASSTRDLITGTIRRVVDWLPPEPVVLIDGMLKPGGNVVTSQLGGMAGVVLRAGYSGAMGAVFLGTATRVRTFRQGATRVTEIQASDGGFQVAVGIANKQFAPGTPAGAILKYLVVDVLKMTLAPTAGLAFISPFIEIGGLNASGSPSKGISDMVDRLPGFSWSIDSGQVYILADGESLPGQPLVVTTQDIPGAIRMRRDPEPTDSAGYRLPCMFAPEIRPGYRTALITGTATGTYRNEQVQYTGGNRTEQMTTTVLVRGQTPLGV